MTVDELDEYGMVRMTDEEITGYLASQRVGVLGLATDGAPSLRPMSFGFDGNSRLYFLYVLGDESRKAELSTEQPRARFLVYSAETPFNWRSVLLTGRLSEVDAEDAETAREVIDGAWRPEVFERAQKGEATRLYRFDIDERTGLKHLGLPPGFDEPTGGTSS
jgi:hypothetical protein